MRLCIKHIGIVPCTRKFDLGVTARHGANGDKKWTENQGCYNPFCLRSDIFIRTATGQYPLAWKFHRVLAPIAGVNGNFRAFMVLAPLVRAPGQDRRISALAHVG